MYVCIYIYIYIHIYIRTHYIIYREIIVRVPLPVSVKRTLLRIRRQVGTSALKAPHLGLDCSFCCWVAGPRLTQRGSFFRDTCMNNTANLRTQILDFRRFDSNIILILRGESYVYIYIYIYRERERHISLMCMIYVYT